MSKTNKFILAGIILAGFLTHLLGIHWGLPSKTLSLTSYHPDEAFVFQSLENMYKTRSLSPKKIALHYGTFHFYTSGFLLVAAKLLGIVKIGSRDFLLHNLLQADRMYLILRFFSVLYGMASVLGLFFVARRVFGEKTALWSSFFLAFSPTMIDISHYAKLDSLLPPLSVALLYWSIKFMDEPVKKNALVCGVLSGILASTRYNCGILIFVPLYIVWSHRKSQTLSLSIPVILGALAAFLITTPYAILEFSIFFSGLQHMWTFVADATPSQEPRILGIKSILFNSFPFGTSWPMLFLFFAGLVASFRRGLGSPEKVLLAGFSSFFVLIWIATARYTYYIAPILPIFSIFAAFGLVQLSDRIAMRPLRIFLMASLILFQFGYGFSYARLFSVANTREQAGEWLLQNVPVKESIGTIRSYFWTPGILRQENPPYPFLKGGGDQSFFYNAVLGLEKMKPLPAYFILSNIEMRFLKSFSDLCPTCENVFNSFLSNYELIKTFKNEPAILGFPVWRRTPPIDMDKITPTLWIYKKK